MPNKNYRKGRRFEYKVRDYFKEFGFNVIRSSASKTDIDLVATKENITYCIQCKNDKDYFNISFIKNNVDKLLKGEIICVNNEILMFTRKVLSKYIENIHKIKDTITINVKETKIFNSIKNYLNSNNLVIINIPKKHNWVVIKRK